MRRYNKVLDTVDITSTLSSSHYVHMEKYNGGDLISSSVFIPKVSAMKMRNEKLKKEFRCVNAVGVNAVYLEDTELIDFIHSRVIGLFLMTNISSQLEALRPDLLYNLIVSYTALQGISESVQELNINVMTIVLTQDIPVKDDFIEVLYSINSMLRKYKVKKLIISIPEYYLSRQFLLDLPEVFRYKVFFLVRCRIESGLTSMLGPTTSYRENGNLATRFVLPNISITDEVNQYFYKDRGVMKFYPIHCTDDKTYYSIIYYHTSVKDVRSHSDTINPNIVDIIDIVSLMK